MQVFVIISNFGIMIKMIKIKNFDSNFLNIYKIWFKSTSAVIYGSYFTININNENPLYLIFNNADGYIRESNGDKYLTFASTNKIKKVLKKYAELWVKIKNQIETVNGGKPIEFKKTFMKIRFK